MMNIGKRLSLTSRRNSMISLLIDTSNRNLSCAVAVDRCLLDSVEYDAWQKQSEFLIFEMDKLFQKHRLDPKKIDEVIVAKGPGSYTGVRIAVSVAKVVALATHAKLYMISSLMDMQDEEKPSICLMNARSQRSYVGVYEGEKVLLADTIWSNEDVLSYINEHPDYSLMGDIAYLGKTSRKPDVFSNLLRLANQENEIADPLVAKPVYLKDLL